MGESNTNDEEVGGKFEAMIWGEHSVNNHPNGDL
jgi:hypothetical protein